MNDTITLAYHIFVDCSVIPPGMSSNNIDLIQTWSDSTNNNTYILNGSGNIHTTPNIGFPFISDISAHPLPNTYSGSYLNLINERFMYMNTGNTSVNMNFRFISDPSQYCGYLDTLGLTYAIGLNSIPTSFTNGDLVPVFLNPSDTLIIIQQAQINACLQSCSASSQLLWECNYGINTPNVFCSDCQNMNASIYQVNNAFTDTIKMERLSPIQAHSDFSCYTDTAGMIQWEYRITNSGTGALDSVFIELNGVDSALNFLTLIPRSSVHFIVNCVSCAVDSTITLRTAALCNTFISDPLAFAKYTIKDFNLTDTILFRFRTFRCSEENNSALLNKLKYYNHWKMPITAKTHCGNDADPSTVPQPNFYLGASAGISNNSLNSGADITQLLVFDPTVSDLSVPHGTSFGDYAMMEVNLKSLVQTPTTDYQLLGGYKNERAFIRVTVTCEMGLRLENPGSNGKLRMLNDSSGVISTLNPVYYNTQVDSSACEAGQYFYYFEITDTSDLKFWTNGYFEYTLQACCMADSGKINYDVQFHLMANPDSCFTLSFTDTTHSTPAQCTGLGCSWLPLSSAGGEMSVHCPGCKAPGIIVDKYTMKRVSFGLQDTNNDGKADFPITHISDTSQWYTDREHLLKKHYSSFSDRLQDYLTAHFQAGDPTDGGYSYVQMLSHGASLNSLQLKRNIPVGLDTMNVLPTSFTLYIDTVNYLQPNCIGCTGFHVDTTKWRTQHILHVPGNFLNQYLDTAHQSNLYLFTFNSQDSAGTLIGNLHNDSVITYIDTNSPFTRFFEGQGYRLVVNYDICGNFMKNTSNGYNTNNTRITSEISNKMFLSGIAHSVSTINSIDQMPNDTIGLHDLGWTVYPTDTIYGYSLVNDTFASSYLFYCETFGGIHYFFSQDGKNGSSVTEAAGCSKLLEVIGSCRAAGGSVNPPTNIYPFEYRPNTVWPQEYMIEIPTGYRITSSRVRNNFGVNSTGNGFSSELSNWRTFMPPFLLGSFTFNDTILPAPVCLTQDITIPVTSTDSSLYAGTRFTSRIIQFIIEPDNCDDYLFMRDDSTARIRFDKAFYNCLPDSTCPLDTSFIQNMSVAGFWPPLGVKPNLTTQISNSIAAYTNQICISVTINNPSGIDTVTGAPYSAAGFVFIALPDSVAVPFLTNWMFITGSDTIFPIDGQILQLDSSLIIGGVIQGQLCASYIICQGLIEVTLLVGWNCDGFPTAPFVIDSVCQATPVMFEIIDDPVAINTIGKNHPNDYSLCEAFVISSPFESSEKGYFYPQTIILDTIPPNLVVISVQLQNCDSVTYPTLVTLDSLNANNYPITASNLMALGFPDSAITIYKCIKAFVTLMPSCGFQNDSLLPSIILEGTWFCGQPDQTTANFNGDFVWDGTSQCTDCFSIDKTALQDTVYVGDTATFQILICGNNSSSQAVLFNEFLPSGFTPHSTIPSFINVPAQGCDTLLVSGYFSTPGSCSDSSFFNTAQIITPQYDTLSYSACIEVLDSCIAFSSLVVPDSAFSTTYGAGFSNTSVYISGVFFIDSTFTLTNCTAYTSSSAQIIVLPGQTLIIDSASVILGCSSMWPGIVADSTARILVLNTSKIRDAHYGIFANKNSTIEVISSSILDCVTGIYTPPIPGGGFVNTSISVRGSQIGLNATAFKPSYPNQPAHGIIPKAGIEINNMVMTLGGAGIRNEFFKMNSGIVANNSYLLVLNSEFRNIGYDVAYSEPYRGTAIVAIANGEGNLSKLTVMPEPTSFYAVHDCHRAIYTDRAVLSANYVHLMNVYAGIYGTNTPHHQTSIVTGCTITTATYGIYWINNRWARHMIATNNDIAVNASSNNASRSFSKTAIFMSESMQHTVVFNATDNIISLDNAHYGIYAGNQVNAKIKFNEVNMRSSSIGIGVSNNDRSSINCNIIKGDYDSTASIKSMGIFTSNSTNRTLMYCNTADSTHHGFFFGGACPNTIFKGNKMQSHHTGLYLNGPYTYIGSQPHHGNRWEGPFNSLGGVNFASTQILLASLFRVDSTLGSVYNPIVSPSSGWFQQDTSGNTFYCDSSVICDPPRDFISDEELNELIASGTFETETYTEESKAIAIEYLYAELRDDSVLLESDSLYIEFMLENQGEPVAYLYDAEAYILAAYAFDSVFIHLLQDAYEQIDLYTDTVALIDEGIPFNGAEFNYGQLREEMIYIIDFLNQTILNLYAQQEASINGNLADAEIRNDLAVPETLPAENTQTVNSIQIDFLESGGGLDIILNNYTQLITIAQQCPYAGGPAVERARAFIAMVNDSVEYFDDENCLQVGIYRETDGQLIENPLNTFVDIVPNPTTDQFEVRLKTESAGICQVIIRNSLNKVTYTSNFKCDDKISVIDVNNWSPGIYFVWVMIDNSFVEIKKLVIVK